jgi:transcription-repair coupling factor (superfamily II helicase)
MFKDLGLLVVDEEQRFGVTHKEAIKARSIGVDVLTLSASPIPRTLEMAFTGIRDLSMITTPPADRRPILTHVGEYNEAAVVEAIRRELLREGQVFFVHNRVSDIDQVARRLAQLVPDARIAVAHGQMDEGTLERVMVDFWERRFDVLVCTTIVESGIDLPSVNTLIVDRAERLGLGQLHQLRGRVGRSGQRAYAYLFHPADQVLSETAYERLRTIGDNTALGSGFKIAMRDLEIRGAGNLLGHDQSGPVAAVGYDLYVQLVAEAVADAKGFVVPEVVTVNLDVPGEAHLPKDYVEADDARLEAYRRLAASRRWRSSTTCATSGSTATAAARAGEGLLELGELRLECLEHGVTSVVVLPARVGIRTKPVVKVTPLELSLSQQMRVRRRSDRGPTTRGPRSCASRSRTRERRPARCSRCCVPWSRWPKRPTPDLVAFRVRRLVALLVIALLGATLYGLSATTPRDLGQRCDASRFDDPRRTGRDQHERPRCSAT